MLHQLIRVSRYLLVLPVIGPLLLTVAVVVMGLGVILINGRDLLQNAEFTPKNAKLLSITVIETIDLFLVGSMGYITAVGIYKLFISQEEEQLLKRIKIDTLADLENKIIGVVVAALSVSFLGYAVQESVPESILHAGVGISLVIGALCLFVRFCGLSEK